MRADKNVRVVNVIVGSIRGVGLGFSAVFITITVIIIAILIFTIAVTMMMMIIIMHNAHFVAVVALDFLSLALP
eukprot:m.138047 g.138047  ORF g.138047 m.138047 type:complete len:74 (-) comp29969_c0_seq2:174-395(-)